MRLLDLSFRYKIPIWGSGLILVTALSLSFAFLARGYDDLKRDMLANSESLGRILVQTLYPALLHDDVWRAFELVDAPYCGRDGGSAFLSDGLIVLDAKHRVFVSSQPDIWPMLTPLARLGPAFAALEPRLKAAPATRTVTVMDADAILLALPIMSDEIGLGHLILVHPADFYWPRFRELALDALLITSLALAVLLPLNWYWGRHMAEPLLHLSRRMDALGKRQSGPPPVGDYPYRDELGRLFQAYDRMQTELAEMRTLEQRMVKSDRMAALGRLSAGIAHEINNPLGGLITALDTLKRHGAPDPVRDRVLPLVERGLNQIRDIVAALLVEARSHSRLLTPQDIEDVHTLLAQEAKKHEVDWTWDNRVEAGTGLPATLVRQVLINLVLNAVQAAGPGGRVAVRCAMTGPGLEIVVENDGALPEAVMAHLFEPFSGGNEDGHGLGLWISHRIVDQLGGRIAAESQDGRTRIGVELPRGEAP